MQDRRAAAGLGPQQTAGLRRSQSVFRSPEPSRGSVEQRTSSPAAPTEHLFDVRTEVLPCGHSHGIAAATCLLASHRHGYTTRGNVNVDGGIGLLREGGAVRQMARSERRRTDIGETRVVDYSPGGHWVGR